MHSRGFLVILKSEHSGYRGLHEALSMMVHGNLFSQPTLFRDEETAKRTLTEFENAYPQFKGQYEILPVAVIDEKTLEYDMAMAAG